MKFMVSWRLHTDKRQAAINAFAQMTTDDDKKDMGDKITLIGRWHDISEGTGLAICECNDAMAMASWALNWSEVLDLQTRVVLDDEEVRAVGLQRAAEAVKIKTAVIEN